MRSCCKHVLFWYCEKEKAWEKERSERWKWKKTENAQVDNKKLSSFTQTIFKVNVKGAVRLDLPFNWSKATTSLPWSTEKTAVTGIFSCHVNVERNVNEGAWNENQNTCGHLVSQDWHTAFNFSLPFGWCFALFGDGRQRGRRHHVQTHLLLVPLWFSFCDEEQSFRFNCQSLLELNEFLVYLGVEKLRGTVLFFFRMTTWHFFCFCFFFSPAAPSLRNLSISLLLTKSHSRTIYRALSPGIIWLVEASTTLAKKKTAT